MCPVIGAHAMQSGGCARVTTFCAKPLGILVDSMKWLQDDALYIFYEKGCDKEIYLVLLQETSQALFMRAVNVRIMISSYLLKTGVCGLDIL